MAISGRAWISAAVPALLCAQIAVVHVAGGVERAPALPDLDRFPARIGSWTQTAENPVSQDELGVLNADRVVSRTYQGGYEDVPVGLFVAWFQSQRGGARQPHSPKVCLPGAGWEPLQTGDISLAAAPESITVNRMVSASRSGRSVFLYWYQTPRRVVAGEWMAKFWLVADAIRDRRTDTALVRIDVPAAEIGDAKASAAAQAFGRDLYPRLREWLPR